VDTDDAVSGAEVTDGVPVEAVLPVPEVAVDREV
jgi:hypothetical protein